ncbi:hypothetical protein E0765_07470 [Sulfuricurvum sp. IAE1]|uniref:hypothetical protein n=1 Tax=Sulfuricurvum sp. IAE1 TaxID=2546102 RepID=UPI0010432648|nr:hypothetical protein [Sulfuricurvum sp. IAE1]TDA63666.1 hypothetical protein E0765_07470 [Sulfuricurvum sp. IAE1]
MDNKLKQILEQTLRESESYLQGLNSIIAAFVVIVLVCSAYLFYSFNMWTLYCIVASVAVIMVAIYKKRKLFNDLTKIAEPDSQTVQK